MTTTDAPQKMSLAELRKYDGTLWVENMTQAYVSVIQDFGRDKVDFHLEPHGEPGYIDEVPKLALNMQGFRKMLLRGDLRISTDENMQEQVELSIKEGIERDRIARSGLLAQTTEAASSRDLEKTTCLACGALMFQTTKVKKEGTPPLCPIHQDKASEYVGTLTSDDKGNESWKFTRTTVEPTRKT